MNGSLPRGDDPGIMIQTWIDRGVMILLRINTSGNGNGNERVMIQKTQKKNDRGCAKCGRSNRYAERKGLVGTYVSLFGWYT